MTSLNHASSSTAVVTVPAEVSRASTFYCLHNLQTDVGSLVQQDEEIPYILRCRHVPSIEAKPHVKWTEDTVDNEFLNKKKSKSTLIRSLLSYRAVWPRYIAPA